MDLCLKFLTNCYQRVVIENSSFKYTVVTLGVYTSGNSTWPNTITYMNDVTDNIKCSQLRLLDDITMNREVEATKLMMLITTSKGLLVI